MVETGIAYKGEVTLTFKIGNKIIKKKTYNSSTDNVAGVLMKSL